MPDVMSLAGSELAEPLIKKTISRFPCVFGFGLFFSPFRVLSSPGCKAVCEHCNCPVLGASASRFCVPMTRSGQATQNIICASDRRHLSPGQLSI